VSTIDSSVRALIPGLIAVVFLLARRYLPASASVVVSPEEATRFSKLQWFVAGAVIMVALCFGLCSYAALAWLNRLLANGNPPIRFVLLPDPAIWMIFSGLGGLLLAWELTMRLWERFGNRLQARHYEAWTNQKAGFNAGRVGRLLFLCIGLPAAFCTILALPMHTSLRNTEMSVGRFGTFKPRLYRYSDVRRITVTRGLRTRSGGFIQRSAIVLDFANGDRWSSADNRAYEATLDTVLLDFLKSKTGLQAQYIDAFPFGTD
jgi:hypothetical protein